MMLKGTITSLITPFSGQEIDEEGFKININTQIDAGIDGLFALGTTGEAPTLTSEEQFRIIRIAVKEAKGKVPILVGTGTNCTKKTIEMTKKAQDLGADGVIIVTPYYNKPTQEGIFRHFEAVSENTNIPIIIYNIPYRCGVNMETATIMRIAELPRIYGLKDCSGSITQAGDIIQAAKKKRLPLKVFSGDDITAVQSIALGAEGVMSVVSNVIPGDVIALVKASLDGEFDIARQIHYSLLPLFKAAFLETNPIPIKAAMQFCGMPAGDCRLPLCSMQSDNLDTLRQVLEKMQLCTLNIV